MCRSVTVTQQAVLNTVMKFYDTQALHYAEHTDSSRKLDTL